MIKDLLAKVASSDSVQNLPAGKTAKGDEALKGMFSRLLQSMQGQGEGLTVQQREQGTSGNPENETTDDQTVVTSVKENKILAENTEPLTLRRIINTDDEQSVEEDAKVKTKEPTAETESEDQENKPLPISENTQPAEAVVPETAQVSAKVTEGEIEAEVQKPVQKHENNVSAVSKTDHANVQMQAEGLTGESDQIVGQSRTETPEVLTDQESQPLRQKKSTNEQSPIQSATTVNTKADPQPANTAGDQIELKGPEQFSAKTILSPEQAEQTVNTSKITSQTATIPDGAAKRGRLDIPLAEPVRNQSTTGQSVYEVSKEITLEPESDGSLQQQVTEEVTSGKIKPENERAPVTEQQRLDPFAQDRVARVSKEGNPVPAFQSGQQGFEQDQSSYTDEQEQILNEMKLKNTDEPEFAEAERQAIGSVRLGEFTIQNVNLRRNVLPGLTQAVGRSAAEAKAAPENWQKHSFELGDGSKIQLTTRQVDGVIQLKLASTNPELTRLLQQYGNEIKEHLEKECNINIDLQFDGRQGNEQSSGFTENDGRGNQQQAFTARRSHAHHKVMQQPQNLQQTVRRFGYNQMEWTA